MTSKRRFRDRWNAAVLKRSSKVHARAQKVKAVFLARGTQAQYVRDEAAADIRRSVRSQSLTTVHLAGQWLGDPPLRGAQRPHCMRAMLVANESVENGFANGTLGRVTYWGPQIQDDAGRQKRTLRANVPDVQTRFYKEESYSSNKAHFLPDIDFLDLVPRKESVPAAKGQPLMLQLQLQPAYCLTNHKVQALTIRHQVDGCLEGVFAHGQIYVQVSRVVDPAFYAAIGIPPADLLDDVAAAWSAQGFDVDKLFAEAAAVTNEWVYTAATPGTDPTRSVRSRLRARYAEQRRVPLRLRSLQDILNPQPRTARVLHGLLDWIDRADTAAQRGQPRPDLSRADGEPLFPVDEPWWLTDLERRNPATESCPDDLDVARIDDDDLTLRPDEAGVESTDSDGGSTTSHSDGSLPPGGLPQKAAPQRCRPTTRVACDPSLQQPDSTRTATSTPHGETCARRRLHSKQPSDSPHPSQRPTRRRLHGKQTLPASPFAMHRPGSVAHQSEPDSPGILPAPQLPLKVANAVLPKTPVRPRLSTWLSAPRASSLRPTLGQEEPTPATLQPSAANHNVDAP